MKNLTVPFLAILTALGFSACQPAAKLSEDKIESTSGEYTAPYFEDTARVSKIIKYTSVVDSIFARSAKLNHNPAIAYGIVVDNKLVYSNSVGYSNIEKKIPATSKTRFRIASMTKSFTAMAILKLRDAGKLQLSDAASLYIPEMKNLKYPTTDALPISIFNLLTMSAGFPEDNPWGDRQLSDSDEDLLKLMKEGVSFSSHPSEAFEYSNLGYALLGKIIGNVSGMSYQQYVTSTILKPLGMNDCGFEYTAMPADKVAVGYRWEDQQWKPEALLKDGSYASMGGMICTIEDFAKYMSFLLSVTPSANQEEVGPVKRSSVREMQQPWKFTVLAPKRKARNGEPCPATGSYGFGLGWRIDCSGRITVSHSGGLPGFGSVHQLFPDLGFGVVAFSNLTYASMGVPVSQVVDTLIVLADLKKRVIPVSPILKRMQDDLMKALPTWESRYDHLFAENFFPDKSKDRWRRETADLFTKIGAIKNVSAMRPENLLRGTFTITGEKGELSVFFTLTPETKPKIQELDVFVKE
ncbi:MAG: beta-lactamase family protein [Cytophagales bacterium]|jgi:CubicO group peptidase (beta-lactamase class C family)|nr:beta-lactamase family protein [Cytophagales bacterium]MCA6386281.1 beta-lactamase family protein [Cytophagales bacterium]MCA6391478.1 beta-lactamase family protein [Cytophagales bacterium]MCA6394676.1 beta-lactamase family protein [Cytophagales bacterium]MCA6399146.1 beta-lactamase family protein [Cytophagales bacterium]